ncbi:MAG: endonuclease/exonuclease/phosphatase family protein [Bacilli bacterium]
MKKAFKIASITVLGLLIIIVGYVLYMQFQYYRIEDNLDLNSQINNNQDSIVTLDTELSISTYNIGFGAYNREFSFFMDSGVMLDGTKVNGSGSRAKSKDVVLQNTNGAIEIMNTLNPDFMLFQEVDIKSTRSHKVNQLDMINRNFEFHGSVFASNFHSAFLFYPILNPHGSTSSGIATLSKYKIENSLRRKLPIDEGFLNKFFDLDRAFTISRFKASDKELVIINVHLSAYDEGGVYRKQQLELLNTVLEDERAKGNYVIAGGDFNHDIAGSLNLFETTQEVPEWVYVLEEEDLADGYKFATSNVNPTCRSTDLEYTEGVNYSVVIDGFIVSENIDIVSVENIVKLGLQDVNFLYSDHNPVILKFKLKG